VVGDGKIRRGSLSRENADKCLVDLSVKNYIL